MQHQRYKYLLLMIVIICSISARGTTQITYDGYKYSIDEATRTATVERQNNSSLQSVSIPGTIYHENQSYTVTAITGYAFYNCRQLTNVSLPSTIKSIGDDAFGNCSELTSINIPEGVTTIGSDAFYYCMKLTSVTLPSTLTSLGQRAFYNCSALTEITIPNGLKTIEYSTFDNCTNLQKVTLPNSITSIGQRAFWYCSSLQSINLPSGITSIGSAAFSWCQKLTNITLPAKLKKIESSVFSCCTRLSSINIPDEVRSIEDNAFLACSALKSIAISKNVTYISPTAFASCKLTSITVADGNPVYDSRQSCNAIIETAANRLVLGTAQTVIPNNIVEIGANAFASCYELTSVELPSSVRIIGSEAFNCCYDLQEIKFNEGLAEIGPKAFSNTKIASFVIPKSVHYIGGQAFLSCQNLKEFEWPASLSSISDSVFQNCKGLTTITIPGTVKRIGKASFMGCTGLLNISIPSSVTSIGDDAFRDCDGFTSFQVPANVTKLGKNVFAYCDNLATLTVAEGNPVYDSREACNAIIETESNTLIMATNNTTIPSTVTAIGDYAFQSSKVSNLTLPKGLTSIGEYAFIYCQNISTLVLPEGFQKLGRSAFFASKLESITLPSTMKEVGGSVFYNCPSLKTVVLPASIEKLGSWAFMSCQNVTDYYCYRATPPSFESLAIEKFTATLHVPAAAVDAYKADANWGQFSKIVPIYEGGVTYSYDPTTLTATLTGYSNSGESGVTLHSTTSYNGQIYQVKHIDSGVFNNYSQMQSIALPDSLVTIGANAFSSCSALTKITLPASVRSLDSDVLFNCKSLTDIYCFATEVPATEGAIINDNYLSRVTLHVPLYLMQQYRQHEVWGKFRNIVPLESVGMPKTYLEYFVDEDPGLGRGRKILIDKANGEFAYTIYSEYDYYMYDQSIFHHGINNLGMRLISVYNDGTTTYSPTNMVQLYRNSPVGKANGTVSYVEYFWDEDPGYGKGTPLSFTTDNGQVIVDSEIEQGKLRGEHTLFVRARSGDTWSIVESQTVLLLGGGPLSGLIVLDPTVTEDQDEGKFNMLSTLLSALSTRGFDIGLNVNVADATYNFVVTEQSIAVVQALYQYLIKMNFYIMMKAPNSATFNFIIPEEFMYAHQEELPQIAAAVQAMFSHIVTENISVLINGQVYQYDGFQVEPNDLLALKNIYNRLNGENWAEKKWSFLSNGRDAAEFPGVEFNTQGRVTSINLYNNNLYGEVGNNWELSLPFCRTLLLAKNNIYGDLAPWLKYQDMLTVDMSYNCLSTLSDTICVRNSLDLRCQFVSYRDNDTKRDELLNKAKENPYLLFFSNKQTLALPSLYMYNGYDFSLQPTVYLLDNSGETFAYYNSYGFAWKSSHEYTGPQDAVYMTRISHTNSPAEGSVYPAKLRYVMGDANMSGATDVLDVQHTLNHILGSVWNFNYSAANTYTDKTINVQDIVCTVNIILAQEQSAVAGSRGEQTASNPEAWLYTYNGQLLLAASKEVGAIDVELSGVSTSQVSLLLNHNHFQMIGRNTEQGARFIIFSPTGQAIPAGELSSLLRLSSNAEIVAAKIADIAADEVSVALGSQPTSIGQVRDGMLTARFQGNQLFIKTSCDMNNVGLRLTSTSGAVVFSTELSHVVRGETALHINLVPGVYVLELTQAGAARKIVKLIKR